MCGQLLALRKARAVSEHVTAARQDRVQTVVNAGEAIAGRESASARSPGRVT